MTTHIMLDLETWGRTPGSDIRSIGAVVFDPVNGRVCDNAQTYVSDPTGKTDGSFYVACDNPIVNNNSYLGDLSTSLKYKLTREHETVQWWNEQSSEAQAAFNNPIDLFHAINSFSLFLKEVAAGTLVDDLRIWANDPNFDVSILEAAYRAVGLPHPWHYRAPRSFRTVVELSGMSRDDMRQFDTGTAHNALDDAISQAKIVCEAYKRLGLSK